MSDGMIGVLALTFFGWLAWRVLRVKWDEQRVHEERERRIMAPPRAPYGSVLESVDLQSLGAVVRRHRVTPPPDECDGCGAPQNPSDNRCPWCLRWRPM